MHIHWCLQIPVQVPTLYLTDIHPADEDNHNNKNTTGACQIWLVFCSKDYCVIPIELLCQDDRKSLKCRKSGKDHHLIIPCMHSEIPIPLESILDKSQNVTKLQFKPFLGSWKTSLTIGNILGSDLAPCPASTCLLKKLSPIMHGKQQFP